MSSPPLLVEGFAAISLDELEACAGLLDRMDHKYVAPQDALAGVAERLAATHRALEIDGARAFEYRTAYFDTPALDAYRHHVQGRRRRFKCRSRRYVDTGDCRFELKLKSLRGRTVKRRIAYDPELHGHVSPAAARFVAECLTDAYGSAPRLRLDPALHMTYRRVTLVDRERCERLTCDFDLRFSGGGGARGRLAPGVVILESKSRDGHGLADRLLREQGIRPAPSCSKYCLGLAMTHPGVRANPFRAVLRRWFEPLPRSTGTGYEAVDDSPHGPEYGRRR